ncbi:hypothetical protein ACFV42_42545 [Streptomyces solisilvae]|uniref:hypothetical protein n=1 Tax=Streptomyces malaysiensis TaxID=92644 RepID=UPI00368C8B0B
MPSNAAEERRLVDAVQIGDEFGLSPGRVNALHADRENTGFPAARPRKGRGGKQEWEYGGVAEYFADREASNRLAHLSEDAGGDPDELLNASQVAKELGYKNPNQITTYLRDHPGYFAEPDVVEHLGTKEHPWTRMRWYRRTITAWRKERRGKGRREGNIRTAPALPKVSLDGDPDELLVAPQVAALLGFKSVNTFSSSLSQGNLPLLKGHDVKLPGGRGRPRRAWPRGRVMEQKAAREQ